MQVEFHDGGYCTHREKMAISTGRFCEAVFPSMFVHFHHEKHGHILYDTGYSQKFYEETSKFPNILYAKLTPVFVKKEDTAVYKLKQQGINPEDIKYIIISHFHADHIAALKDFPNAKFIYFTHGFEKFDGYGKYKRLVNGYLLGLIPEDFKERTIAVEQKPTTLSVSQELNEFFSIQYDIFGDGSLLAIELPGHARGQLGLYFTQGKKEFFLVADSCWLTQAYEENIKPAMFSYFFTDSAKLYNQTLEKIHMVHKADKKIIIVPSHCGQKYLDLVANPSCTKDLNGIHS